MDTGIKAIETQYKGYKFRSRLEARYAVFFDALGIKYEYEEEGFTLSDGTRYLPDFYLPTFDNGMYVEVKPEGGDFSKAIQFSNEKHCDIWLAEGTPAIRAWLFVSHFRSPEGTLESATFEGIPNADSAEGENRMYTQPGYENPDLSIPEHYHDMLGYTFLNAVEAARQARFEHGEKPFIRKPKK